MSKYSQVASLLQDYIQKEDRCCLLSLKPEYAEKILSGRKRYEYRRRCFQADVTKIFLYATKPKGEIIGYFYPGRILLDKPEIIWEKTNKYSGLDEDDFWAYCRDIRNLYAISVSGAVRFSKPVNPYQIDFRPPQSYYYI